MRLIRLLLRALVVPLPWPLKRLILGAAFGYRLDPAARIGLAWAFPEALEMGPGSSIGHLTVIKGVSRVVLGEAASIGRGNWITAYPRAETRSFAHATGRRPELHVGAHAAITNRHIVDCTDCVTIGEFTTFAGFRSQILTHSIDLATSRQDCAPVTIGRYCFVGTGCVLLGGAELPDHCVLGALSLLNKRFTTTHTLYGGVPAAAVQALPADLAYFRRPVGYVE